MIKRLRVSNFKRISVADLDGLGSEVVVAGKNGAGKSSVLDAIMVALAGKAVMPDRPVHGDADAASITLDIEGYTVTRTIKPDGSGSVRITTGEGAMIPQPQTWLDSKIGRLAFDPAAFLRQKASEQADTIRRMTGVDVADIDQRKATTYAQRTQVGRDRDTAKGALDSMRHHTDAPAAEVAISDLLAERTAAAGNEARRAALRAKATAARQSADERRKRLAELEGVPAAAEAKHTATLADVQAWVDREVARINAEAEARRQAATTARDAEITDAATRAENNRKAITASTDEATTAEAEADGIAVGDIADLDGRIARAETDNAKARDNAAREAAKAKHAALVLEYDAKTAALDAMAAERAARIAAAKMPIEGLSIGEDGGLTFGGMPLSQASQAEQIRVSMAIGIALAPSLKVVLIRDGSLLDEDSRALVHQIAEAAGAQTWIEVVGSEPGAVEIVDGAVAVSP